MKKLLALILTFLLALGVLGALPTLAQEAVAEPTAPAARLRHRGSLRPRRINVHKK